jgi:hypothetical protein
MSPIRYLDFDLRIQRTEAGFCSQVLNSPAGEANSSCEGRIFTELELESYLLKLGPRRALRRVGSPRAPRPKTWADASSIRLSEARFGIASARACPGPRSKGLVFASACA